jgi:multidrug efflux pump subunit AcrB
MLRPVMAERAGVVGFALLVVVSIAVMLANIPRELAPQEDGGVLFVNGKVPRLVSQDKADSYLQKIYEGTLQIPELEQAFQRSSPHGEGTLGGMISVKPWEERSRSLKEIQQQINAYLAQIVGPRLQAFDMPSMPGTSPDFPLKLVVATPTSPQTLMPVVDRIIEKAQQSGLFVYVNSDLHFDKPQYTVRILRDRAAQLGIPVAAINDALSLFLTDADRGKFILDQRAYQIMFQTSREFRDDAQVLKSYYLRASDGSMVPLSTVAQIDLTVAQDVVAQFQQLNSATLGMMLAPNVSMGDAIAFLDELTRETLPQGFVHDYVGQSRQFIQEGNKLLYTFLLSTLLIYLVLAAQFESFRDPLIVLISVPMSICGALIPLALGMATLNIYTQIGLVTLIGLISKHGILIVDFANRLREREGLDAVAAVQRAAATRLRPILMTTVAMVCGVLPLLLATGPGQISRQNIGLVIAAGMLIGTVFTLFIVPALYVLLSKATAHRSTRDTDMPEAVEIST